MNFIMKYGIAYVMDLIFGDPHWFPHPVRIIGKLISFLEKILYFCVLIVLKELAKIKSYNNLL